MSVKSEEIKVSKYGRIVWEHSSFTSKKLVGFFISLFVVILLMNLLPILILSVFTIMIKGTFISNLFVLLFCIGLAGGILYLFYSVLFTKSLFYIKFTESHLLIKRRIFGIPRRFELSNLMQVEIRLLKEKEWFKIRRGRGWYATISFSFRITTIGIKDKNYSFEGVFYEPGRGSWEKVKQRAFEKRTNFENELHNLTLLFPGIIMFGEEDLIPKKSKRLGQRLCSLICLTVVVILFFGFMLRFETRTIVNFLILIIVLFFVAPIIKIIKKSKEKKDKMKEGLNTQEF